MTNVDFGKIVDELSQELPEERCAIPFNHSKLPSIKALNEFVSLVRRVVFPGFFDESSTEASVRKHYIGVDIDNIYNLLQKQVARGLQFTYGTSDKEARCKAEEISAAFLHSISKIKQLLFTDVIAMAHNDPAVRNLGEVIFCYPVVQALVNYRIAHELHLLKVPIIPRIITEMAHSATGIDIHPGATIGDHFCIDHGTGVVIGETCIIGSHVMLYQGVTLGAKNFSYDDSGHPLNVPRHPILEDNVTVYSNASVLGRITIGHDSVIGGNVWVTNSVAPYTHVLQSKTKLMKNMDFLKDTDYMI
ncbi:MAG: serine acetyltransferase [Bacteroidales bacterium]|nr:serine acetyltransferase [Bacteroidales bacterium]